MNVETEHGNSYKNKPAITLAEECGCFSCVSFFRPGQISEWWDVDASGVGQTAVCPLCGMDAVIPQKPGVDLPFLKKMNERYF